MTLKSNTWIEVKGLSLATFVRDVGFDLAIYDSYSSPVRRELQRKAINEAIKSIKQRFHDQNIDISSVKSGVYVISLSAPLSIKYSRGSSQIIYIGQGNLMGRIKTHFNKSLFRFMRSVAGANFDFHFAWPKRQNAADYYKHVEWMMLDEFKDKFGGISEKRPYPILNKNAGSYKNIKESSHWWKKPLKNSGKRPLWTLELTDPTKFAPLQ
jgi:hypothetical protein